MRNFTHFLALLWAMICFTTPVNAVHTEPQYDQQAQELAADFNFMFWTQAFRANGQPMGSGTGFLIENSEANGAGLLMSRHGIIDEENGNTIFPRLVGGNSRNAFDDIEDFIEINISHIQIYSEQDMAVVWLPELVRNESGELIEPVDWRTVLNLVQNETIVMHAGTGRFGPIDDTTGTDNAPFDGIRRACWARYKLQLLSEPTVGITHYEPSIPVSGVIAQGDSGGPTMVEVDGSYVVVGVNDQIRDAGSLNASTGFEVMTPAARVWIQDRIDNSPMKPFSSVGDQWRIY